VARWHAGRVDVAGPLDRRCPSSERLFLFHTPLSLFLYSALAQVWGMTYLGHPGVWYRIKAVRAHGKGDVQDGSSQGRLV